MVDVGYLIVSDSVGQWRSQRIRDELEEKAKRGSGKELGELLVHTKVKIPREWMRSSCG